MTDNLEMLTVHSPSAVRRYIPRCQYPCGVTNKLHADVRNVFRVLSSYSSPDWYHGSCYRSLSLVQTWIRNNRRVVRLLIESDFHHTGADQDGCPTCSQAINTGYYERVLDIAAEIVAEERKKVAAAFDVEVEVSNA